MQVSIGTEVDHIKTQVLDSTGSLCVSDEPSLAVDPYLDQSSIAETRHSYAAQGVTDEPMQLTDSHAPRRAPDESIQCMNSSVDLGVPAVEATPVDYINSVIGIIESCPVDTDSIVDEQTDVNTKPVIIRR